MIKPILKSVSTYDFIMGFTPYCSFLEMIYWVGTVYIPINHKEYKPSYAGLVKLECLIHGLNE